jgi:hypothetical protein
MSCPLRNQVDGIRARTHEVTSVVHRASSNRPTQLFAGEDARIAFISLSLLGSLLPLNEVVRIKIRLSERCSANTPRGNTTLTICYIKETEKEEEDRTAYDSSTVKKLFQAWWSIAEPSESNRSDHNRRMIASHLASIVREILMKDDLSSALVYSLIVQLPENEVIGRCLGFTRTAPSDDDTSVTQNEARLLKSLIEYDGGRFIPCFLTICAQRGRDLSRAWEKGLLDSIVTIVRCKQVFIEPAQDALDFAENVMLRASRLVSCLAND